MEYNEIKNLLDKYLAGETSQEEEKALSQYFAQANVHADFEEWKPLFNYFSSEKNLTVSDDFDEKILSQIQPKQSAIKTIHWRWLSIAASVLLILGVAGVWYKSADKNKNAAPLMATQTVPVYNVPVISNVAPDSTVHTSEPVAMVAHKNIAKHKSAAHAPAAIDSSDVEAARIIAERALALLSENLNKGKTIAMESLNKVKMNIGDDIVMESFEKINSNLTKGENIVKEDIQKLNIQNEQKNIQ
jgi:hypothetical protein